jgi:hypothetical protein
MRWVAVITLLCAIEVAHADTGVSVVAYGDPGLQAEVATRFERWLRKNGFKVVDAALSVDAINTLANCFTIDDMVCARGVFAARSKTDALVYVGLAVADKNVTFNVYWFVKGKDPIGERRACEKCETEKWHEMTDKMMTRLTADAQVKPTAKPQSRLWPSIVTGAGVATIGVSAIFFYYGSLGGPDQKYIYETSTPVGIALGAVGVGTTAVGLIWLLQSGSSRSQPVAAATADGGYIGWAGRF